MEKQSKSKTEVFHFDLYGKRDEKYNFLNNNSLKTIEWNTLEPNEPNCFFTVKNFANDETYVRGFRIDKLFGINNVGIVTARDAFTLHYTKEELSNSINKFILLEDETARKTFKLGPDARDWKIGLAKSDLKLNYPNKGTFIKMKYRPFDYRWTFFTGKSKGFHSYPRFDVMGHLLKPNISLIVPKQAINGFNHVFLSNSVCDKNYIDSAGQFGAGNVFPLYLYPETNDLHALEHTTERTPNLNPEIVKQIAEKLGLEYVPEKINNSSLTINNYFAPIDILDYIYAVLHSPTYREKYKEFLKIDFPRVPYPKDKDTFWQLVKLGGEIRQIHLLESPTVEKYITQYPIDGDNVVEKPVFLNGRVFINETQYFDHVPQIAWDFYIGGYQPAQKWLKDRKGRKLEFEDILHYQKIIVALSETDRLMKEIDGIEIE